PTFCTCSLCAAALTRALRSSPTRRSSDLGRATGRARRSEWSLIRRAVRNFLSSDHTGRASDRRAHPTLVDIAGHFAPIGGARRSDRKSTRLNSSHQIISYAVFCLKKKKNN